MIEEKESQTLKVLLVSPASLKQVVAGKALVGLFYSMLPALLVMLLIPLPVRPLGSGFAGGFSDRGPGSGYGLAAGLAGRFTHQRQHVGRAAPVIRAWL
jgi:ABC-type Na+ efflux pump permease subunit